MSGLKYPWKFYIWDLGGTLLDNYEISTAAFLEALTEFGIPASHDDVYEALRVSTEHAVAKFAPTVPGFLERYRELEAPHLEDPILYPGVPAVLAAVTAAGGANYLVSHRDNQVLNILKQADIAQYFTEVVTKDSGFARKPDPAAFNYLITKYELPRDLTATVGDRPIDIEAGQAAGIATICFGPVCTHPGPTICIDTLTDLITQ